MIGLQHLPPELLLKIVECVAIGEKLETEDDDSYDDGEDANKYRIVDKIRSCGLSLCDSTFSVTLRPDVPNLRTLRLVSKQFSQLATSHLFRCVRLLPSEESAARYNEILSAPRISQEVQKVIFQTRMEPGGSESQWARIDPGPGDDYHEPHPYFLDALKKVGRFSNLTSAEVVFSCVCLGKLSGNDFADDPEPIDFREDVLVDFFAGLNHCDHPASKVNSLSIKNLQDRTPDALIKPKSEDDNNFKENFSRVMSRITHFSLQIATENDEAAPENQLDIEESHDFFGYELQRYWLNPIAVNLVYLKLYSNELYFGMYPKCELPMFPQLRTLCLGNMSIAHDSQIDWILSHSSTLEELILDDVIIAVGATYIGDDVDIANRRVAYSLSVTDSDRPSCRPKKTEVYTIQKWLYDTRWHHVFTRIKQGVPKLQHFAIGHGRWDEHAAFDEAESLSSELVCARYQYFDRGIGPSNWLETERYDQGKAFNDWEKDEAERVYRPECDEDDWRALNELLDELTRRRCS